MKRRFFCFSLALALMFCMSAASASEISITLSGTLEYDIKDMGVDLSLFSGVTDTIQIDTLDGGRLIYAPSSNAIQAAYVDGMKIITALFDLSGTLERYYVETFGGDFIPIVQYLADGTLQSFSLYHETTDTEYKFGGNNGWFVYDAQTQGNVSCAAPNGYESLTVSYILEYYPPIEIGAQRVLPGNHMSLSGSSLGKINVKLGDELKLTDCTVGQIIFLIKAADAPFVTSPTITLLSGSVLELLVFEGDVDAFNPAWIYLDNQSRIEKVQLPNGNQISYADFLSTLN